jgi:hypothetical protein
VGIDIKRVDDDFVFAVVDLYQRQRLAVGMQVVLAFGIQGDKAYFFLFQALQVGYQFFSGLNILIIRFGSSPLDPRFYINAF